MGILWKPPAIRINSCSSQKSRLEDLIEDFFLVRVDGGFVNGDLVAIFSRFRVKGDKEKIEI